jgi:kojibiose phosphorylase
MQLRDLLSSQEWLVEEPAFKLGKINLYETLFTVGNGYQGTRGALEEGLKGGLQGTYLAGVFDHHDSAVIDLVNAPNWLPLSVWVDGERLNLQSCKVLGYRRILDLRKGLLYRFTRFEDSQGRRTRYESVRFASFSNQHLCGIKFTVTPENYTGTIAVESLLDGDCCNLDRKPVYVPPKQQFHPEIKWQKWAKSKHLEFVSGTVEQEAVYLQMKTLDTGHQLGYAAQLSASGTGITTEYFQDYEKISQVSTFQAKQGQTYDFEKLVTIFTSRDVAEEELKSSCLNSLSSEIKKGIDTILDEHVDVWNNKWEDCDCVIQGDPKANHAVRFNIYHLLIVGNPDDSRVNIGAKSLSGEGYRGHVFWDTEVFMLPFFIFTQPDTARALEMYRYHTMTGAIENAKLNGFRGSQFPWESADTGHEETPKWTPDMQVRIWTGEEEIQITADVAYGIMTYFAATGDIDFFLRYGVEVLFNTARFWESRLEQNEASDRFELNMVIGPDEFHEHVNNNVFTNWMAQWNLYKAIEIYHWLKKEHPDEFLTVSERFSLSAEEVVNWQTMADKIYIPYDKNKELIEEFEGYFQLKDIPITEFDRNNMPIFPEGYDENNAKETTLVKQPDVVMLMYVLPDEFADDVKRINYEYYEKRTMHKSSLSPCIHSIMGIEVGDTTKALQYFYRSAFVDLNDNQGNTEDGIHIASAGGTWMTIIAGFGGFRVKNDQMTFKPWLPERWEELRYKLKWHGDELKVTIRHNEGIFTLLSDDDTKSEMIVVYDNRYTLESGKEVTIAF